MRRGEPVASRRLKESLRCAHRTAVERL